MLLSSEFRLSANCRGVRSSKKIESVEIPFPDGSRVNFSIQDSGFSIQDNSAWAMVIKDAGDDPDVTNGAEIKATASFNNSGHSSDFPLIIKGSKGVGVVTKPGLPLPIGEAAINPVPRKMISEAVLEAIAECGMLNAGLNPKSKIQNPKSYYVHSLHERSVAVCINHGRN